jgi:hypothetical protein
LLTFLVTSSPAAGVSVPAPSSISRPRKVLPRWVELKVLWGCVCQDNQVT